MPLQSPRFDTHHLPAGNNKLGRARAITSAISAMRGNQELVQQSSKTRGTLKVSLQLCTPADDGESHRAKPNQLIQ